MKQLLKKTPFVGYFLKKLYRFFKYHSNPFVSSEDYWLNRYKSGENSGDGSYGDLSEFKATFINGFVTDNNIKSIIELGSGDGNQLTLAKYSNYTGYDISPEAVSICSDLFKNDRTKSFKLMNELNDDTAELTLSLDVIYHLIEDQVFKRYMQQLFSASDKFVIIYSSNTNVNNQDFAKHFKNRKFTDWCEEYLDPRWTLINHTPNKYPFDVKTGDGSVSDFFIYQKV